MAHVLSCEFLRCEVESHSLFQQEYARTNRERGVKLLRCFPHCCPDHVKRSYCGCSVRVVVTFSTDVRLMDLDDILVYTRFEPTRVVPLWPESLVSLAQDLGAPGFDNTQENRRLEIGESVANFPWQSGRPGDGWVRGERVSHQHLSNNKALYVLNGGKSPKWFYHYDSSITRTQREMTHHLVAYIFRLGDNQSTTVVARHASPAFVLMSYRRSHGAGGSGAMEKPQNSMKQQKCPYVTKKPSDAVDQRKSQTVGTCEAQELPEEDSSLWQLDAEHYYPGFREKGLHILILLEFLQRLTLEDIHVDTRLPINHWLHVFSALQSPLSPQSGGIVEFFLSEICRDTGREGVSTIQMTLYLLIRALSYSTVRHLIQSALKVDSKELHDSFTRLISCSYDFLNGLVQDTSNATISTLVDDVLSIVYSQGRFNVLRGQLSNLLLGQQAPGPLSNALNRGLCTFKTLMLQCGQQPHSRAPLTPKTTLQSAWSRRWLLEPGSLKLSDGVRGIIPTLRVVNVALFFRECGCVDLQLESDMSCLIVHSAFSILGESSMELVLDGKLRPASKLPSGLTEWIFSDYAASFSDGGQSLEVDLFAFSSNHNNTGVILRRSRLSMSLEQQLSLFVLVQGDISGAMYQPQGFGDEFLKLPAQERTVIYESLEWTPVMEVQAGYVAIPDSIPSLVR